jgi:uncharacterized protein (DUF1684 family)
MERRLVLFLIISILFAGACNHAAAPTTTINESVYKQELEKWQSGRLASLTKEDGWLTLIGLFWLEEGENKFGSAPKDAVVLPKDKAPLIAGSFWLQNGRV